MFTSLRNKNNSKWRRFSPILFFPPLVLVAACSGTSVRIENPRMLPAAAGSDAAVYFVLRNLAFSNDIFLGATSEVARTVEIHRSTLIKPEDQQAMEHGGEYHYEPEGEGHEDKGELSKELVMPMVQLISMRVASGYEIEFEPEYYYLMLIDLQRDLQVGDQFILVLHFENSGLIEVRVQVTSNLE